MAPRSPSPLPFLLAILFLPLIGIAPLSASGGPESKDLSDHTREASLKELAALEARSRAIRDARISGSVVKIREALKSGPESVDLMVAALEQTRFRNMPSEFQAWRKRNQDLLRNSYYGYAAQFQLRYLMMALGWNDLADVAVRVSESMTYLKALYAQGLTGLPPGIPPAHTAPDPSLRKGPAPTPSSPEVPQEAFTLLGSPLANTAVVEWFGLAPYLPESGFAAAAGNVPGILEKNIREPLRSLKDPSLPETWDEQIKLESSLLSTDAQKEAFQSERLPELLASKANDTAAIGQPNRALAEYLDLIRSHPDHPKSEEWIKAAKALASPASPIPAPTATLL